MIFACEFYTAKIWHNSMSPPRLFFFSRSQGWPFLTFRFWMGAWIALLLLIIVARDWSALVGFITRFTEEAFVCLRAASLLSILFIHATANFFLGDARFCCFYCPSRSKALVDSIRCAVNSRSKGLRWHFGSAKAYEWNTNDVW